MSTEGKSKAGPQIKPTSIDGISLQTAGGGQNADSGSSPLTFDGSAKTFNIAKNYRWTVSDISKNDEIPQIVLYEHRNLESNIMRSIKFYTGINIENKEGDILEKTTEVISDLVDRGGEIAANIFGANASPKNILDVYNEIFPDSPTSLKYIFPYYSKSYMSLQTAPWEMLDKASKTAGEASGGVEKIASAFGFKGAAASLSKVGDITSAIAGGVETAMSLQYPLVGTNDRPRVFASHTERSVTVEFPLYNTIHENDWKQNRLFLRAFMSQNLFIKRDFMTGLPPVFYRVLVPGQYFSFASSVTDFNVENLGNVRMMHEGNKSTGKGFIIPDAWQVKITLSELAMPSLNQFQAAITDEAYNRVVVAKP
jgi:hypothetical protein